MANFMRRFLKISKGDFMLKAFFATLLSTVAAQAIAVGTMAPTFSAKNQDGKTVNLSDFAGKPVLLYFYPKDETPGCIKEACEFRDKYADFKKQGAVVLGVSRQDEKSHKDFSAKHKLPFDLLVDTDGGIAKAYGIAKYPVIGLLKRQSVLIGSKGQILKVYDNVDPDAHAAQALKDIAELDKK
jgi:peroxiredoxin Q/BCP